MISTQELTDFRALILGVERTHRAALRQVNQDGGIAKRLYDRSLERFKALNLDPMDRVELERLLPHGKIPQIDFLRQRKVLFLRPSEKGGFLLPVISLKCDFARQPTAELRLRVGLCVLDPDNRLRVLGYRFEMPENDGSGRHDFYHLQLIRAFEKGAPPLNDPEAGLDWMPDVQPSFPLDATGPLTLILSFLVTVYGLWYLDEMKAEELVPANYLESLSCWKGRPAFWRVRDAAGKHKYFSDALRREPIQVREIMRSTLKIPRDQVDLKRVAARAYNGVQANDRIDDI
jgi:hypothetical protein